MAFVRAASTDSCKRLALPRAPLVSAADGREVEAQISAKSLRKVLATIAEHGADKVAVILQGKLAA